MSNFKKWYKKEFSYLDPDLDELHEALLAAYKTGYNDGVEYAEELLGEPKEGEYE